jgi:hypothetical protein
LEDFRRNNAKRPFLGGEWVFGLLIWVIRRQKSDYQKEIDSQKNDSKTNRGGSKTRPEVANREKNRPTAITHSFILIANFTLLQSLRCDWRRFTSFKGDPSALK